MKLIRAQHRPWLVYAACSLLSLAVMTSNLQGGMVANTVESYVLNLLTPLYSSINWAMDRCQSVWNDYLFLINLRQENLLLRQEVNRLKEEQITLQTKAESAERLQTLIVQSCRMPGVKTRAHVVRRANSLLNATLLINAGTDQGFRQGLGVATADGVIGQIVRVGPQISKVLTLHHPDAGVGAMLQQSRIQGVVSGTGK
ncbi:MAG TPA: rod shape-determining protein MreC, partial [bacterium]|nr:rod shape-determining protein MreC [bacterium]